MEAIAYSGNSIILENLLNSKDFHMLAEAPSDKWKLSDKCTYLSTAVSDLTNILFSKHRYRKCNLAIRYRLYKHLAGKVPPSQKRCKKKGELSLQYYFNVSQEWLCSHADHHHFQTVDDMLLVAHKVLDKELASLPEGHERTHSLLHPSVRAAAQSVIPRGKHASGARRRKPWTVEETDIALTGYLAHGPHWSDIVKAYSGLDHRAPNDLGNRMCSLRKMLNLPVLAGAEDINKAWIIYQNAQLDPLKNVPHESAHKSVVKRDSVDNSLSGSSKCRNPLLGRTFNAHGSLRRVSWEDDEVYTLLEAYREFGPSWGTCAKRLALRNGQHCRDKIRIIKGSLRLGPQASSSEVVSAWLADEKLDDIPKPSASDRVLCTSLPDKVASLLDQLAVATPRESAFCTISGNTPCKRSRSGRNRAAPILSKRSRRLDRGTSISDITPKRLFPSLAAIGPADLDGSDEQSPERTVNAFTIISPAFGVTDHANTF